VKVEEFAKLSGRSASYVDSLTRRRYRFDCAVERQDTNSRAIVNGREVPIITFDLFKNGKKAPMSISAGIEVRLDATKAEVMQIAEYQDGLAA